MGIKFGEIDAGQILINEYKIMILEKLIGFHTENGRWPNRNEFEQIKNESVRLLQNKYPNSGVELSGN
jgi:hypothetical protein